MGGDGGGEAPREPAPAREAGPHPTAGFPQRIPRRGSGQGIAPAPSHRGPAVCLYQSGERKVSDLARCGDRDRTCSADRERGRASVLPPISD